jgi:hypothetical protein
MTRISALSDIGTSVASNDIFVLVDVSDPTTPNKKIQQQNLFLIPDGSAGTPAVRFLNDTDVGLFRPTTNTLALATGGSERLRIDSSGRVGIGTSSPVATNHIRGSGTSGQVTASWILENASSGTAGMDVTGAAGSSIWRFLYGGGPSTGTNTLTPALTIGVEGAAAGRVGIGTTAPGQLLEIHGASNPAALVKNTTSNVLAYFYASSTAGIFGTPTVHPLVFNVENLEKARIDTSGRLLVGTSSTFDQSARLQVIADTGTSVAANFYSYGADNSQFVIGAARGTVASPTTLNSNDTIGGVYFRGHDGTSFKTGAQIQAQIDGITPSSDLPSRLVFSTTADGASSPTERLRIDSSGRLLVGTSSSTGSLSNTAPVIAGLFQSFDDVATFTTGVAQTLFVIPNTNATYIVTLRRGSVGDAANYEAVSILSTNSGGSVSAVLTDLKTAANVLISISGTNLQGTQSSGGNASLRWIVTRVG